MAGSAVSPSSVAKWLGIGVVCLLTMAGSVALAWWQWDRYETGGTWQNLGYVLQWPLFGAFPAFLVWRISTLNARREEQIEAPVPVPAKEDDGPGLGYVAPRYDPEEEPDPTRAEYNRYLAALNAGDRHDTSGRAASPLSMTEGTGGHDR